MKKRSVRLFLLVFSLTTLVLIALLVRSDRILRPLTILDFSGGWEYSWDELPRDSFDAPLWNYERIDRLDWESIDFPSEPPDRNGRSLVWLRARLPQEKFRDPVLFIFSIDINAEFYIGGERIHSFGSINRNGRGAFIGWSAQLIELPPDSQGREMYVRVFSDYHNIGLWGDILIGNKADLIAYMYRKDLCGLTVLIISLLIGLVFLASYFLSKNQRVSLYLSIISILLAIRIFGRLYVSHFTFPAPMLPVYIDAGTSALIPFFIICIFRSFLEDMFRGLTSVLIYICLGMVLAGLVIFSAPSIPVYAIYDILDAGMTGGLLLLVYVSIRCLKEGTREQKYLAVNFMIMAVLTFYSILMNRSIVPFISELDYLLVFQFSFGLALILGYGYLVLYRSFQKQSVRLESTNRQLEKQVGERTLELEKANRELEEINFQLQREKNQLKVSSITDGLTGLYNRTYIEEQFRHFIKESSRYGQPFSIAMCDLDHFKLVNDQYGHNVGDKTLRMVADTFHQLIRETDIAGRFGGEEFLLLFPRTEHREALLVAERIRVNISKLVFEDGPEGITISIGVSQYRGESAEELLNQADKNLYIAKQKGRNQVV